MANGGYDLARLVELTIVHQQDCSTKLGSPTDLGGKLDVDWIRSKINDGTMAANVEDRDIVLVVHVLESLRVCKKRLHFRIGEELLALAIFEHLETPSVMSIESNHHLSM